MCCWCLSLEEFEDTNGAIKIRKKDRQCNGQEKKDKRTNNDLQSTTHKVKDQATRTGDEHMCSIKVSRSCSTSCARRVTLDTNSQWLPSLGNPGRRIVIVPLPGTTSPHEIHPWGGM